MCKEVYVYLVLFRVFWLGIYVKLWGKEIVVSFIFGMGVKVNYGMFKNDFFVLLYRDWVYILIWLGWCLLGFIVMVVSRIVGRGIIDIVVNLE